MLETNAPGTVTGPTGPMIVVDSLRKSLRTGSTTVDILKGIDFTIERGEFAAIMGASGSGKSTLLGLLAGLDNPTSGNVHLNGTAISYLPEDKLAQLRGKTIGFVFQSYQLIPTLTALENVLLPYELNDDSGNRKAGLDRDLQFRRRSALAHLVDTHRRGIAATEVTHFPHVQHRGQHPIRRPEVGNAERNRPQAANLMLGRDGAFRPGMRRCVRIRFRAEAQALALPVFEIERQAAVPRGGSDVRHALGLEPSSPPRQAGFAAQPQSGAHDAAGATLLRRRRPVKEGDVGPGRSPAVRVKQMIGRDIILVDGFLYQSESEGLGKESKVSRHFCSDGREMVDSRELHGKNPGP